MKKLSYLLILCIAVFFASCSSCSHKDQSNVDPLDIPTEFENNLTDADTARVKELIGVYMAHMQNQEYYDAAAMVYRHEEVHSQIVPRELNNEEIERLVNVYKLFPVQDYKIDYMRFREAGLNEVCITVIMQKGENGKPDATSKMFFNPIHFHNKWCLVLDDSHQGTDAFVPAAKRDSMRGVYQSSKSGQSDPVAHPIAPKHDGEPTVEMKTEADMKKDNK